MPFQVAYKLGRGGGAATQDPGKEDATDGKLVIDECLLAEFFDRMWNRYPRASGIKLPPQITN